MMEAEFHPLVDDPFNEPLFIRVTPNMSNRSKSIGQGDFAEADVFNIIQKYQLIVR